MADTEQKTTSGLPEDSTAPDAVTAAANAIAERLNAVVFLYSGFIDEHGYRSLISEMEPSDDRPHRPNAVLFLTTYGGIASQAYRIARIIQATYERFVLCVSTICKSSGTLIALGANQIMMNEISEVGPLDVQLTERDEIGQIRSGMVVRTALKGLAEETFSVFEKIMLSIKQRSGNTVSLELSSKIASDVAAQVMAPIYAQVDPDSLGKDLRDLDIATAYGERLSDYGKNVRPGTIQKLVEGYPSHDFIIDKKEAETLFYNVDNLDDEMINLLRSLGEEIYLPQSPCVVRRLDRVIVEETGAENRGKVESENPSLDDGRQANGNGDQGGE